LTRERISEYTMPLKSTEVVVKAIAATVRNISTAYTAEMLCVASSGCCRVCEGATAPLPHRSVHRDVSCDSVIQVQSPTLVQGSRLNVGARQACTDWTAERVRKGGDPTQDRAGPAR
jgi:hypothetical protein